MLPLPRREHAIRTADSRPPEGHTRHRHPVLPSRRGGSCRSEEFVRVTTLASMVSWGHVRGGSRSSLRATCLSVRGFQRSCSGSSDRVKQFESGARGSHSTEMRAHAAASNRPSAANADERAIRVPEPRRIAVGDIRHVAWRSSSRSFSANDSTRGFVPWRSAYTRVNSAPSSRIWQE